MMVDILGKPEYRASYKQYSAWRCAVSAVALDHETRQIAGNIESLRTQFRERAAKNDRERALPLENLADLHEAGVFNLLVSQERGGLGSDVISGSKVLPFVVAMEELARADMSTAHSYQVHNHAANILEHACRSDQIERYLQPSIEHGVPFCWVASEPGRTSNPLQFDTVAQPAPGGFVVTGLKNYATNAQAADWILIHVARSDLRKQGLGDIESSQLMMIRRDSEGVEIDASWWNPTGMRACVSPKLTLNQVFVPEADLVAEPGFYVKSHFGSRFHLGIAANYLGASQSMLDFVTEYLPAHGNSNSPLTQRAVGEIARNVWAARALVRLAAYSWQHVSVQEAELLSLAAKHQAITSADRVADLVVQVSGSTALFEGQWLERVIRDLLVLKQHAHADTSAQILGMGILGKLFDPVTKQYLVESLQGPPQPVS
jgi:alkylation response protein AidB-like acyl-CoA dehydrogenase